MSTENTAADLDQLQEKLAYLEATVDELTRARVAQDEVISALTRRLQRIEDQMLEVLPSLIEPGSDEPSPPHY